MILHGVEAWDLGSGFSRGADSASVVTASLSSKGTQGCQGSPQTDAHLVHLVMAYGG